MKLAIILSLLSQFAWAGIELTDSKLRGLITEDINIVLIVKANYADNEYIKEVADRNIFQEIIYFEEYRSGAKLRVHSTLTAYGHDWDIDELMHVYNFSCISHLEESDTGWSTLRTICEEILD